MKRRTPPMPPDWLTVVVVGDSPRVIKDTSGKPVTCGKCAAFGTNSKGPGAHSPDCPERSPVVKFDAGEADDAHDNLPLGKR